MIYGKLTTQEWETAKPQGELPSSSFIDGKLRLFFYGELYNFDRFALCENAAKAAASLFLKEGVSGFSKLDGAFTIIYYTRQQCGIVRDHHGTHSSVYYTSNGEYSTSLLHGFSNNKAALDKESLSHFLQSGIMKLSRSALQGISRLEAGCCLLADDSNKAPVVYKSYPCCATPVFDPHPDIDNYSHRYAELHSQAIRRRVGNSNRVGILLSGGYDSGSNLAALRSVYGGQIDSYSIGFKGDSWTELPLARIMSETFGTRHHEYEIDGSEITALPAIVDFLGEPFVEGGLMVNYCAMRMIGNEKPDVILGGDGSDQYFGTTGREISMHYLAHRWGMLPLLKGIFSMLDRDSFDKDGKQYRIRFHLDKILHIMDGDRFGFSNYHIRDLLQHPTTDWKAPQSVRPDHRSFDQLYTQHALLSDLETIINRVILFKASRMARMFDNHLAFPFMDLDLYHFLQELPVGLKCKGDSVYDIARGRCTNKYLLKHYYKPLLPEAITSKKKQGGFAPMALFFRDPAQRARLKEFILTSQVTDDFLNRQSVERFLTRYDNEVGQTGGWFWYRQNRALQYFNLLTMAVWWQRFVEKKEVSL